MKKFNICIVDYEYDNDYFLLHENKTNEEFENDFKEVLNSLTDVLIDKALVITKKNDKYFLITSINDINKEIINKLYVEYGYKEPIEDIYSVHIFNSFTENSSSDYYDENYKKYFTKENLEKIKKHNRKAYEL